MIIHVVGTRWLEVESQCDFASIACCGLCLLTLCMSLSLSLSLSRTKNHGIHLSYTAQAINQQDRRQPHPYPNP